MLPKSTHKLTDFFKGASRQEASQPPADIRALIVKQVNLKVTEQQSIYIARWKEAGLSEGQIQDELQRVRQEAIEKAIKKYNSRPPVQPKAP